MVLALLLAAGASAFSLLAPTVVTESSGASFSLPPDATGGSVTERRTEDGSYVVRETVSYSSGRTEVREYVRPARTRRTTLLEDQPDTIVPLVTVALAVAGFPLLLNRTPLRRRARIASAALLLAGSLLGASSVGLLYLPSAAAMTLAAGRG
jgi:hypothetical protein